MIATLKDIPTVLRENLIQRIKGVWNGQATWQRQTFFPVIMATFGVYVASLALPILTLQIYDRILVFGNQDTLFVLIIGVITAMGVEFALKYCRDYLLARHSASQEMGSSIAMLERFFYADPMRVAKMHATEKLQHFSAVSKLVSFSAGHLYVIAIELLFTLVFLGVIAYLCGALVLIPLAWMVIFALVAAVLGKALRESIETREQAEMKRDTMLIEVLERIHLVKALALEHWLTRRFEGVQEITDNAVYRVAYMQALAQACSGIFAQLMTISFIAGGALAVIYGTISGGAMVASLLLSGRLMQPIQKAMMLWARYQETILAQAKLEEIMALATPEYHSAESRPREGTLTMSGVSFAYEDAEASVIDGLELTIEQGDTIVLTGERGSGKSTLLKLMSGVLISRRGQMMLDGQDITTIPPDELTTRVAYLCSQGEIYRGSILDNLTGFRPEKRPQAMEIASLLGIDEAVSILPTGYDTQLEGNITDLIPPGLKQRIAIARALIDKPRLILFDDADRALDQEGYNHIFRLLGFIRGKASLVVVSDDKNLQQLCSRYLTLRRGVVVESFDATVVHHSSIRNERRMRAVR